MGALARGGGEAGLRQGREGGRCRGLRRQGEGRREPRLAGRGLPQWVRQAWGGGGGKGGWQGPRHWEGRGMGLSEEEGGLGAVRGLRQAVGSREEGGERGGRTLRGYWRGGPWEWGKGGLRLEGMVGDGAQ